MSREPCRPTRAPRWARAMSPFHRKGAPELTHPSTTSIGVSPRPQLGTTDTDQPFSKGPSWVQWSVKQPPWPQSPRCQEPPEGRPQTSQTWPAAPVLGSGSPHRRASKIVHLIALFPPCLFNIKNVPGLHWWSSGWESDRQCRGHKFDPWSRKIPPAKGQLGPCTAAETERHSY